jgi:hypothetical protein
LTRVVDEISLSRNFAEYLFRISRNNFFVISRISYREIVGTKFREMYWYMKNLHNEIISRNTLYEISRNKVQRNFAEFREIKITFVVTSYFAKLKKSYFATTLALTKKKPS